MKGKTILQIFEMELLKTAAGLFHQLPDQLTLQAGHRTLESTVRVVACPTQAPGFPPTLLDDHLS